MKQQPPDPLTPATGAMRSTTVLNRVAPTVVRRRVVEVPVASGTTPIGYSAADDEDDEAGPPSSVNVARALASLRGHELARLEEILSEEDEEEAEIAAASGQRERPPPSLPRVPTVRVGPTIALSQLAQRLGVEDQDLVTSLVTHGFFSVTVKTTLPRETARAAATLYGYQIEETDEVTAAAPRPRAPKSKPTRAKAEVKAEAAAATKAKPTKKPAAAALTRRTSRRA